MAAACNGNVEFIMNILKANPELVWNPYLARDLFMLAIEYRQAEVFSLIYGLPDKQAIASLRMRTAIICYTRQHQYHLLEY
ncbi:hypothetical protein TIFTF001_048000 [Ficus carica]|uniref:Uncharacterized protein n=1 Tax=Ficus carica TaxID=3494 RepID=A0AA87ZWE6_FICCA|nr:hypothetical protein TIFTF001_048000 [Ficus carica]